MSKRYIDTSFRNFIKYKLNEITKSQQLDIEIQEQPNDMPQEESELEENKNKKKEPKFGSREYMAEMIREFEEIQKQYDNLY